MPNWRDDLLAPGLRAREKCPFFKCTIQLSWRTTLYSTFRHHGVLRLFLCYFFSFLSHALLEANADPNTFPMIPNTPSPLEGAPLHIVTSSVCSSITTMAPPSSEIVSEVGSAIVRELRSHGAKLGSVTMALLPDAAKRGRVRAVEFLLRSAGVDPNYRGRQGMTSLILASRSGRTDVVKFLLEKESSDIVGITDDAGKGAIDYARANGKEDIVRLLLEKGAR